MKPKASSAEERGGLTLEERKWLRQQDRQRRRRMHEIKAQSELRGHEAVHQEKAADLQTILQSAEDAVQKAMEAENIESSSGGAFGGGAGEQKESPDVEVDLRDFARTRAVPEQVEGELGRGLGSSVVF